MGECGAGLLAKKLYNGVFCLAYGCWFCLAAGSGTVWERGIGSCFFGGDALTFHHIFPMECIRDRCTPHQDDRNLYPLL